MNILLISTYELGHQPLHVASPAAALMANSHQVKAVDTFIDPLDMADVAWADGVAISVPMHTAMRLGLDVAASIRSAHPATPLCLYGLYAAVGSDRTLGELVDRVIAGEYEEALVDWAESFGTGSSTSLAKTAFHVPARQLLPPLDRYARLSVDGTTRIAGYVEATHGCRHRCGHCPIPALYDGMFRVVSDDVVKADIDQLVAMGATHITFGDPDFFNGPHGAMRLLESVHRAHPSLTFDITVKVEHILGQAALWPKVAELGVVFVVSAFETTNDEILTILDKGHTAADMEGAIDIMRSAGIEIRPSWMPFTPWTTIDDVVDMFRFVAKHDLAMDPIQFAIRLLIPDGSVLLDRDELTPHLGAYRSDVLSHDWTAIDPSIDDLAQTFAKHVDHAQADGQTDEHVIADLWAMALDAAGLDHEPLPLGSFEGRPRLTESWFC